jgi:hypothetical protein
MPRGRKPAGERALTGAERQARYRATRAPAPAGRYRQPTLRARSGMRRSRPQRWHAAVSELLALQAEYATWLESSPEATRGSATAEALQAIVDLDLDELSAIEPPRGFGRD